MANLLIGSSNLDRHYKASDFTNIRTYKMLKCTKFEGYIAFMGGLVADNKNVLISVIENFIVDAVGNETAKPEVAIDDCIKKFLSTTQKKWPLFKRWMLVAGYSYKIAISFGKLGIRLAIVYRWLLFRGGH
jgi:hypothetical protein